MKFFAIFATILAVGAAFPSTWTLQDLSAALMNPNTDPAIIPYLEDALNDLYAAIHAGQDVDSILVPIPGIVPVPEQPALIPVPEPATPLPVSSPLVQVIVNVNNKLQQIHEIGVPESPAIIPSPVDVVDSLPVEIINPSPVEIVNPAPVEISPAPMPVNPEFNPIDVIAINPEPVGVLEVNPAGDLGPLV